MMAVVGSETSFEDGQEQLELVVGTRLKREACTGRISAAMRSSLFAVPNSAALSRISGNADQTEGPPNPSLFSRAPIR